MTVFLFSYKQLKILRNCFDFDNLECYVSRSVYEAAIKFLSIGNDLLQDNKLYNTFILKQIEGEF